MRSFNFLSDRNSTGELARNRCERCDHEWQDRPFGHAQYDACPNCGSFYWQWLDYGSVD